MRRSRATASGRALVRVKRRANSNKFIHPSIESDIIVHLGLSKIAAQLTVVIYLNFFEVARAAFFSKC